MRSRETDGVKIPQQLRDAAIRYDGGMHEWIARLPRIIAKIEERWSLQAGEPYEPGGQASWVAPARNDRGDDLVLKVGWQHYEAAHEADGLRLWDGDGAVILHDAIEFDQTSALLLERCVPGTPLGRSLPEIEQDVIVAGLLRRLWRPPPEGHRLRPLALMCDQWAAEFETKYAAAPGAIDPGIARDGIELFRALPGTADRSAVLCTDLHAENILAAAREPWLVIDPKPWIGDPAYDALQHMLQCGDRLRTDPIALVERMAALLELDPARLRLWLFARCVQESIGNPLLAQVAARIAP